MISIICMMIQYFIIIIFFIHNCQSKASPPILIEQPQDMIAELDKPMAIHCRTELSSLDDLRIDWYKDGRLVTTDPNARIITEFMALHIINTMPQDAGIYHCVAKNTYGQTQSRKARIQFLKLDRDFLVSPSSMSTFIGEQVRLRCQPPNGLPSPIVYWTKDGKNLSMPLDRYDLVLTSVQKSDFGSYRCVASNGLVRQSSIAELTEFRRPKITIQPTVSRIDLRRGQSINLQCHVDNEQYTVEWYHEKKITRNNNIYLSSVDYNQSGIYNCVVRFEKYRFEEQILVTVHDSEYLNNEEIFYGQSSATVFAGRSATIDCPLPWHSEKQISWTMMNDSEIDNVHYEQDEKNSYRLKINRIKEVYHNIVFKCYYHNKDTRNEGLVKLAVERVEPPPIVLFVPNNQTVPVGIEVVFSCQLKSDATVQWWFTPYNRPYKTIKINNNNNQKYKVEPDYDLIVQHAEKNDAGTYKCVSTNENNDETTWTGHLNVEDTRSNVMFHRVERRDLPQAPSQPIVISTTSRSIELIWTMQSSDILDYLIEYYEVSSDRNTLEWQRVIISNKHRRYLIENLKPNSVYQFMIRERNSFGYGPPSPLSDLIETKTNLSMNEELIHLNDPIDIQETSITIKWSILGKTSLMNRILIHIFNKYDLSERIETVKNALTTYTIANLRPNTEYTIYMVPMFDTRGQPSNSISFRTLESVPSAPPAHIAVQLVSTTVLSIRWNAPLENETNGQIVAYKVNCLGSNETTSIRLTNISSDVKQIFIKNLIESTDYCISIAARTRIGYGPYSQPICVHMHAKYVLKNQSQFKHRLHQFLSQPWLVLVIVLSTIVFTCACAYMIWLCFHYIVQRDRPRIKFNSSSSSSNQSVELPVHKRVSNGKRYDLIKDTSTQLPTSPTTLWMNSMQNGMRLQCCTTTPSGSSNSEHYSTTLHKNPINALLHESRQQQLNPYATTGIFQQATLSQVPNHSEKVHSPSSSHHLSSDQQQINSSSSTVQYQPPWFDHHPSATLQYHSQSRASYNQYHCIHCTSRSHPQTPASIRPAMPSTVSSHQNQNLLIKNSNVNTSHPNNTPNDVAPQTVMNSSSPIKPEADAIPQLQPPNSVSLNTTDNQAMVTSWSSSNDGHDLAHASSSSSDKFKYGKSHNKTNQSSSEGSLFSDSDAQEADDANVLPLVTFERGPSFFTQKLQ